MTIAVDAFTLMACVWTGGWIVFVWGLATIRAGHIRGSLRALALVFGIWLGALAAVVAVLIFMFSARGVAS